ncbi:Longin-like domain-containing protein [Chaetomium sp. MPI-SDFR-AT-0129]|nr:Longin-like domain-containing protein [Chaetomium sp. MPI-SDFR-AT-0129]
MTVFALIIINKAGGLIYNRTFHEGGLNKISTNDYLVLAGTFHGVHAITARLNPLKPITNPNRTSTTSTFPSSTPNPNTGTPNPSATPNPASIPSSSGGSGGGYLSRPDPPAGLEVLETENFRMQCFTTLTGTKFLLFTDTTQANVDLTMRRVYDMYADYVMKNPFYQLEMPVRCDMFERKLGSYIREINNR